MTIKFRGLWALAALALVAGCGQDAERDQAGGIVAEGAVDVFTMHVGDCFDDQADEENGIDSVPGKPCNEPHDNEVFYKFDVSLSDWPGDDAMEELGYNECLKHFQSYVGQTYEDSSLEVYSIRPTSNSWNRLNLSLIHI